MVLEEIAQVKQEQPIKMQLKVLYSLLAFSIQLSISKIKGEFYINFSSRVQKIKISVPLLCVDYVASHRPHLHEKFIVQLAN